MRKEVLESVVEAWWLWQLCFQTENLEMFYYLSAGSVPSTKISFLSTFTVYIVWHDCLQCTAHMVSSSYTCTHSCICTHAHSQTPHTRNISRPGFFFFLLQSPTFLDHSMIVTGFHWVCKLKGLIHYSPQVLSRIWPPDMFGNPLTELMVSGCALCVQVDCNCKRTTVEYWKISLLK